MGQRGGSPGARDNSRVIIGPWSHSNFSGSFPEREFGLTASSEALDLTGLQLWFDRWLKGTAGEAEALRENGVEHEPPVTYFAMGIDQWRTAPDRPLPNTQYRAYYLHSEGAANSLRGDGTLSRDAPLEEAPDVYLNDPLRPVPTVGGQCPA